MKKRRDQLVICHTTLQSIVLTLIMLLVADPLAVAGTPKASPSDVASKVQALGVGHGASVWLNDGSHRSGKIASIDATSFTLDRGHKHGTETVAFVDVSKVQKSGLTTGDKVSIGVLGSMAGAAIFAAVAIRPNR